MKEYYYYKPFWVSVITVTYNAQAYLERTIQSVLEQDYPYIEYIIIDGGSKDKTVEIIQKYQSRITCWISEPDNGLYDAMNKGMKYATGDYLLFMNAGDVIFAPDTLSKIFRPLTLHPMVSFDVFYGDTQIRKEKNLEPVGLRSHITPHKLPDQLTWQDMQMGMVVSHQAFIVAKHIAPTYDLTYKYSSDVDWMIRCLKNAANIQHTHQVIAAFLLGGVSSKKRKTSLIERYKILKEHFGFLTNLRNHFLILLRGIRFIVYKRKKYWD